MNITDGWGSRVAAYLVYRRSFGFELAIDGRQLESFAHFADQRAAKHRTPDVAADWARNSTRASQIASARRIETLRGSAKFQVRMDHDTVIPKPNATRAACATTPHEAAMQGRPRYEGVRKTWRASALRPCLSLSVFWPFRRSNPISQRWDFSAVGKYSLC
jgi:hypothetical protein